jgi:hypothetical protein
MTRLAEGRSAVAQRRTLRGPTSPTREPLGDLIASIDLPALVEHYAGEGRATMGGARWKFACPHPDHADNKPSFTVYLGRDDKWRCGCFSQCGEVGDALEFVKWVTGCSTGEAAKRLREFRAGDASGIEVSEKRAPRCDMSAANVPGGTDTAPTYTVTDDTGALRGYLAGRGWPDEVAEAFGLKVVLDTYRVKRVLHPFEVLEAGQWVQASWQARRLDGDRSPKWIGPNGSALPLYNLRALDKPDLKAVVICEGPADTVTAWLALRDLPEVGAVGVAGAQGWRTEFAPYFEGLAVVIAGDNDTAGETFTTKVARGLRGVASLIVAACPSEGVSDLTDMAKVHGLDEVRRLLTEALPVEVPTELPAHTSAEKVALIMRHFPGAYVVCPVCSSPTSRRYCERCEALTMPPKSDKRKAKPREWARCNSCNFHALGVHRKRCYVCNGTFERIEAVAS